MRLTIERLSKTYANGTHALKDISLDVPRGMFGLLGPNGAGKSTLMRTLATLQDADSGTVHLGAIDVLRDKDAVRRVVGYAPQEFGVYPDAIAEELLTHFAILKGVIDRKGRQERVQALLRQTNLWEVRRRKLGTYSGGMRQRFGIAVALLGAPQLIIVDEPTAGLDPAERVRFLNLLSELGESAVVILSTHIVDDVSELCSRMAIINEGRILLQGEPPSLVAALRDKIWRTVIDRNEIPAYQERYNVVSSKLFAGRTEIRVFADRIPASGFSAAEPNLTDVYFTAMHGLTETAPPRLAASMVTV